MFRNNYRLRYYIKVILDFMVYVFCTKNIKINNPDNTILFMLACDYNNVGDMEIATAQEKFLKESFPNKEIIKINLGQTYRTLRSIKRQISNKTILVLTGGGNAGDKYAGIERARDFIIKTLKKNNCKIIGFPQTIDYSLTPKGNFYLQKSKKIYNSNPNFVFVTREQGSYDFAKKNYSCKVLLTPDIVLSIKPLDQRGTRSDIGTLFRSDAEKNLSNSEINQIFSYIKNDLNMKIEENDMTIDKYEGINNHKKYTKDKLSFVSSKKIILTDRLHGMIFCYITNTPCIVFNNSNHKIQSTYDTWLKNKQNYIILENDSSDMDTIKKDIQKLLSIKETEYADLDRYFSPLRKEFTFPAISSNKNS